MESASVRTRGKTPACARMRCGVVRIVDGLDDGVDGLDTMASSASTMDSIEATCSAVVAHNLHRECYVT